ncbi:MAG: HAMP domain-containing histidine kinase [Candidatus Sericytochromatia bacterium]|nr:HAMP domain-containing histidine kinase [Candidatus Sericytochromatia bacterium]
MVRRSLVATIFIYAIAACLFLLGVAKAFGDRLVAGDRAAFTRHLADETAAKAGFVGMLVEDAWTSKGIPPAQLDGLQQRLHLAIRLQGWPPSPELRTALTRQKVWQLPTSHTGPHADQPPPGFFRELFHVPMPPPFGPFFHPGPPPGPPPPGMAGMPPPGFGGPGPGGPFGPLPRYWVRIVLAAQPVGALYVSFPAPAPSPGPPPTALFALGWVLLLAVLIVPPLLIWVIRPLRRMVTIADRLGGGDLETAVAVHRHDEFGHLERAFETMRVRLRQVLLQKEQLLTDVSHELRGPLSRMEVAARLMTVTGTVEPYVQDIHEDIQQVDGLLGELLLLMRGKSEAPLVLEQLDLASLTGELLKARRHLLMERHLRVSAELDPAPLQGDRRLILRALGNVIDNAIKYTGDGGAIRVTTQAVATGSACIVADNGPGIAAAHLPHLFEPFYRPDTSRSRETGGTGLGLAITRAVVMRHGGSVACDSAVDVGTTVTVVLPAVLPA